MGAHSEISVAEQQFGLAVIGRLSGQAEGLTWRNAANGRPLTCAFEGFRIHLGLQGGAGLLELQISGPDSWPILRLSAETFAPAYRTYVAEALIRLHTAALQHAPSPGRPTAARIWNDPLEEDALLADLVERLSITPTAGRPGWLSGLGMRISLARLEPILRASA